MKNFFIKEEFSFFVLLYTFIKKDTILTLIYIVMKISHIEHLGIAVKSIEEALPYYENVLGLKCYNIETVEDQKVRTAFLKVGDVKIELLDLLLPKAQLPSSSKRTTVTVACIISHSPLKTEWPVRLPKSKKKVSAL